jgi:hypothetical protein
MKKPARNFVCSTFLLIKLLLLSTGNAHGFLHQNKQSSFIRTAPSNCGLLVANRFSSSSSRQHHHHHCTRNTKKTALSYATGPFGGGVFDPLIEAELCTTMAHVTLDFTSLASQSSSRSLMRRFSVIGRVFAISADYLPDHSIHTEELMIQVFLLSLALRELLGDKHL